MKFRRALTASVLGVAVLATIVLVTSAGAGAAGPVGSGTASATKSVCGLGTGKKATGTPIMIDGLDMLIPGVDFTTIGKTAAAYFACVNDNGGINGRPVKYTLYTEALDPNQEKALAKKMIEGDKAIGIVGNTSFAECGTNWKYYKSKGYIVIGAGVQAECYSTPSFAEVNSGPRYSNVGAAQALVKAGAKKLAIASPDTISAYADGGAGSRRTEGRHPGTRSTRPTCRSRTRPRSCSRCTSSPVTAARILLDFTPDTAPAFMKAAEAQGIVDKVMWGSSTPIANTFMSGQFSPAFDGHLWIDNEFSNVDPKVGPDSALMFAGPEEVRPVDRPAGVRADGLPRRGVRDARPAQHQGRDHRQVVQQGGRAR